MFHTCTCISILGLRLCDIKGPSSGKLSGRHGAQWGTLLELFFAFSVYFWWWCLFSQLKDDCFQLWTENWLQLAFSLLTVSCAPLTWFFHRPTLCLFFYLSFRFLISASCFHLVFHFTRLFLQSLATFLCWRYIPSLISLWCGGHWRVKVLIQGYGAYYSLNCIFWLLFFI